jgi:endonuclease/exonuclease/phosphatase family metal-dependent hydrolase
MKQTLPEAVAPSTDSFTVVTYNILLDKTRSYNREPSDWDYVEPQSERLPSIVEAIRGLDVDLDAVAIQEAHETREQHNGKELARQLGFEASYWYEHNQSMRKGENIGVFGNLVHDAEVIELPHDKKMVKTMVRDDVVLANIHLRNELWGPKRAEEMQVVIDALRDHKKAVIVGDTNSLFFEKSRRMLYRAGFRSGFGIRHPVTFPTPEYRRIMLGLEHETDTSWQERLLRNGIMLDVVYVRNLGVKAVGRFKGDSDHFGLYASIKT